MSRSIDERIVSMQFDNKDFERNASTTLGTLDKLKRSLNLSNSARSLTDINAYANKINLSGLGNAIEQVKYKFSALEIVAATSLANITNKAINAGERLVKSLSVDQISAGWSKYGQKVTSVQTIMNATGKSIDEVNGYLDKLMWFSDETSYGFTDMTAALGQLTSAGGDIDKLIPMITGIANATAFAGKGTTEFSRAIYNLNQSYASGSLQYMDWRSLELAGVASKELKQTFIDTGVALGKIKKGEVTVANFSQTLKDKWADTEVMEKAFGKFGEMTEKAYEMVQNGEVDTASEAYEILAKKYDGVSITAAKAAQEAKTFTEAIDATKDAVSSGWMKTFELIFGNYQEAKTLWTDLANALWDVFASGAEARNEMLQGWKDLGGRDDLIESFWNTWEAVGSILGPIKEAFKDIFPDITSEQLFKFTEGLKNLTEQLTISEETADKIKRTFKGVFSILNIIGKGLNVVATAVGQILTSDGVASVANLLLTLTASIGDFFTTLDKNLSTNELTKSLSGIISTISELITQAVSGLGGLEGVLNKSGNFICKVIGKVWDFLKDTLSWFSKNVSAGDIFAGLAGGSIFLAAKNLAELIEKINDKGLLSTIFGGKKQNVKEVSSSFSDVLSSAHDALVAFQQGIKVSSLIGIAVAVTILISSLRSISDIDTGNLIKSLSIIGSMFLMLNLSFKSILKSLTSFQSTGLTKMIKSKTKLKSLQIFKSKELVQAGIAMVMMAEAIKKLSDAVVKLADVPFDKLITGLFGVGVAMFELTSGLKAISKAQVNISTSISMIALAESCKMLSDALSKFATLSWDEISRGLTAMGGALGEFVLVLYVIKKFAAIEKDSLYSVGAMLAIILSLDKISENLRKFASMSWEEIGRGLTAMGGALGEFVLVLYAIKKWASIGKESIYSIIGIVAIAVSLDEISENLRKLSILSWEEIARGLTAMGGALSEFVLVLYAIKKWASIEKDSLYSIGSILVITLSLDKISEALSKFAMLSWEEIARGLTAMGGALGEFVLVLYAIKKWSSIGLDSFYSVGAILAITLSLGTLAESLSKFSLMSWEEIARGLVAMGGALAEVGGIIAALSFVNPLAELVGAGSLLLAIQGLDDLASALKRFGEMSWDEIGRGLASMGGALLEIAGGGFLNSLSILGSLSISTIAEPLGTLADSVNKWKDVSLPLNLGINLSLLASGISSFTLSGFGADALATAAPAVGVMAESVKKWAGVYVPDGLGDRIGSLAGGITAFTLSGFGADALATAAPAVGEMAESVKKWADVSIPEGLKTALLDIATGVEYFTFAFLGAASMGGVAQPLSDLAGAVAAWSEVKVPETIQNDLISLAKGVKAFSFAFLGGWSMDAIKQPLADLADSVVKWNGISVPENIATDLKNLADGVKEFSLAFLGGWSLSAITGPLGDLADSVTKFNNIKVDNVENASKSLGVIADAVEEIKDVDFSSVSKKISDLSSALNNVSISTDNFYNIGSKMIEELVKGFDSKISSFNEKITGMISKVVEDINTKSLELKLSGSKIIEELISGIDTKTIEVSTTIKNMMKEVVETINGYYTDFYSSGKNVVSGFAAGISDNSYLASMKAAAMASAAVAAAKEELKEHSPSKVFYGIGDYAGIAFVNALSGYAIKSYKAGSNMAESAKNGLNEAISKIYNIIDSDMNLQPTIRPVVDLSNVSSGVNDINEMFNGMSMTGVMSNVRAINSAMNLNQNGPNDDVVYAINKLRKDLGNINGNTYNINGISTSDSDVVNAIETIIRAVTVERRV